MYVFDPIVTFRAGHAGDSVRAARRCARLCLALTAWLLPGTAHPADIVAMVLSERGGAYAEVTESLRRELPAATRVVESLPDDTAAEAAQPRLVIAVGTQACSTASRAPGGAPVLCTLIPRAAFERATAAGRSRTVSALLLDQPPRRQMALVRLVLPGAERVAMLIGAESESAEGALSAAAARYELRAVIARTGGRDDLAPAIQKALDGRSDALLAVPDSRVFNAGTVQNILHATMRGRIPLFAFSPAYVRAGALAAVHSTPEQVGRETGRMARDFLGGRALPPPQAPREFSVTVNGAIARAFGLALPDEQALAERVRRLEQGQ